jgi:hypothetical protein
VVLARWHRHIDADNLIELYRTPDGASAATTRPPLPRTKRMFRIGNPPGHVCGDGPRGSEQPTEEQ